jgi:ubiquinone/menaquinone biosynthesis C-methylase UbiE
VGFYSDHVVPRILDLAMDTRVLRAERRSALAGVRGIVLEVGFGTGHNLPFYPPAVDRVVALDPSSVSARLARKRIACALFPVDSLALSGEAIPAPDASYDSVVTTFTLCTIPDPLAALRQMKRVLKPGGRFFFLEHGRSPDPAVQRWQDRLTPLQRALVAGCHLNRDIPALITTAGFTLDSLAHHYLPGPRFAASCYRGVARP